MEQDNLWSRILPYLILTAEMLNYFDRRLIVLDKLTGSAILYKPAEGLATGDLKFLNILFIGYDGGS